MRIYLDHDLGMPTSSRYVQADVDPGQSVAEPMIEPVPIIQGDQDCVSPVHGEVMFGALTRLGKRATFVRYAAQGHKVSEAFHAADEEQRIRNGLRYFRHREGKRRTERRA